MDSLREHLPFLNEMATNPSDDLPCLIYADWLEENGQAALAEFQRLKIEINRQMKRPRGRKRLIYRMVKRFEFLLPTAIDFYFGRSST